MEKQAAKRSLVSGSDTRAGKIREAQKGIRCVDCDAVFPILGEHWLRGLRDAGWRHRTTGTGGWVNVCPAHVTEACW